MTLGQRFLLHLNGRFFKFKKNSFRYYGVSIAWHIFCKTAGKVVCIRRIGAGRNSSAYNIVLWNLVTGYTKRIWHAGILYMFISDQIGGIASERAYSITEKLPVIHRFRGY